MVYVDAFCSHQLSRIIVDVAEISTQIRDACSLWGAIVCLVTPYYEWIYVLYQGEAQVFTNYIARHQIKDEFMIFTKYIKNTAQWNKYQVY